MAFLITFLTALGLLTGICFVMALIVSFAELLRRKFSEKVAFIVTTALVIVLGSIAMATAITYQ